MITSEMLQKLQIKKDSIEWAEILNNLLPKYNIDSPQRIAAFIAQCSHESGHFEKLIENLNYGAKGLVMTWPKRFTSPELANKYARQPEMIANFVYANRLGNGDELSGDGWKYRGRGLIQLTGKYNYQKFADTVGMDLEQVTRYLETKQGAAEAACLFWKNNKLNSYADVGDIKVMTKVINGGYIGLPEREENYRKALNILGT
jgi:putative chitinase